MGAPSHPLAYLLTWTCYGTWLHGDERGSVDDQHNVPGMPFMPSDKMHYAKVYQALRHEPVTLNDAARRIVHEAFVDHAGFRTWELLAVNVRTNHVHVVVQCGHLHPRNVMRQFKDWATRCLRGADIVPKEGHVWTDRGSTRYLWEQRSVTDAISCVSEYQGEDLLNPSPLRKQRT